MILLELTTLTYPSGAGKMGLPVTEDDVIRVKTFIYHDSISYFKENPDNDRLTNIYMTGGHVVTADLPAEDLLRHLAKLSQKQPYDE
jgi:hypothetical protein